MKKILCLIMGLILGLTTFSSPLVSFASDGITETSTSNQNDEHYITEPYQYPILPGMDEWRKFDNNVDMMEACLIPEDILKCMTTEALLETVLSYPLLSNMFRWETVQEGYEFMLRNFNGLQELMQRPDLDDVINTFSSTSCYTNNYDGSYKEYIKNRALNVFSAYESNFETEMLIANNPIMSLVSTYATYDDVRTPSGTLVRYVYANLSYADHLDYDITEEEARQLVLDEQDEMEDIYPNAVRIAPINSSYNCHSYAWHSTSQSNIYWLKYVYEYIEDGSYNQITPPLYGGEKILYKKTGGFLWENEHVHSAIYMDSASSTCYSKWGQLGVYRHGIYYNPYYENGITVTYWRLAN